MTLVNKKWSTGKIQWSLKGPVDEQFVVALTAVCPVHREQWQLSAVAKRWQEKEAILSSRHKMLVFRTFSGSLGAHYTGGNVLRNAR